MHKGRKLNYPDFINFYFIGIMIIEKLKVGENGDDRETIFVKGSDDF